MNIIEQYTEGSFVSLEQFETKYPGLPSPAHIILWRRENSRLQTEHDAHIEKIRADRLLDATFVKLDNMTIEDRFGLEKEPEFFEMEKID